MSYEKCPWEATIKENQRLLTGNGNKGIVREITALKTEMEHSNRLYEEMNRNYGILAKSLQNIDVKEKVEMKLKEKRIELKQKRNDLWKRIVTIVGLVFTLISIIYIVLDHV